MSFGEFVSSGFGLWVDDAAEGSTTVLKQEKHVSWGDDRKYFQANAADNRQDESYCQIGEISTETRDIEELALTLVEERNQLLKLLEQAQAEVNTLKTENTDLRNENKFRHRLMKKMKRISTHTEIENSRLEAALKRKGFLHELCCDAANFQCS